jgi:hypothetical protein
MTETTIKEFEPNNIVYMVLSTELSNVVQSTGQTNKWVAKILETTPIGVRVEMIEANHFGWYNPRKFYRQSATESEATFLTRLASKSLKMFGEDSSTTTTFLTYSGMIAIKHLFSWEEYLSSRDEWQEKYELEFATRGTTPGHFKRK